MISEHDIAYSYADYNTKVVSAPEGVTVSDAANKYLDKVFSRKDKFMEMSPTDKEFSIRRMNAFDDNVVDAASAMGEIDQLAEAYYDALASNGDPTPTKATSTQPDCPYELRGDELVQHRIGYIKETTGFNESESKAANDAMYQYTIGDTSGKTTQQLDKFIDASPAYNGEIYRGLAFGRDYDYENFVHQCEVGATIGNRPDKNGNLTVSSWTSKLEVCSRFSGAYTQVNSVELICKKNKTSAPIQNMSDYGSAEAEVLAKSTAQWTVVGKKERDFNGKKICSVYVVEKDV